MTGVNVTEIYLVKSVKKGKDTGSSVTCGDI